MKRGEPLIVKASWQAALDKQLGEPIPSRLPDGYATLDEVAKYLQLGESQARRKLSQFIKDGSWRRVEYRKGGCKAFAYAPVEAQNERQG